MNIEIYNKLILERKPDIEVLMKAARPEPDDPEYLELKVTQRGRSRDKVGETKLSRVLQKVSQGVVNADGSVDIDDNIDLAGVEIKSIKDVAVFGVVRGEFICYDNLLTNLIGAPYDCYHFDCSYNQLTSLKGSPDILIGDAPDWVSWSVEGWYDCSHNQLTSLEDGPSGCNMFDCSNNKLTTLKGCPEVISELDCSNNYIYTLTHYTAEFPHTIICDHNAKPEEFLLSEIGRD